MHNLQDHDNFGSDPSNGCWLILDFLDILDDILEGALAKLKNHVDVLFIGMRLVDVEEGIRGHLSELGQYLSLNKWLM